MATRLCFLVILLLGLGGCDCTPTPAPVPAEQARDDDPWTGHYDFTEAADGQTWTYDLRLTQQPSGVWDGTLAIDGFQTRKRLRVRGDLTGTRMQIVLVGFGRGHLGQMLTLGTPLLTLELDGQDPVHAVTTRWQGLRPILASTPVSGRAFSREPLPDDRY